MNPIVSIIIPVYNAEKTIRRCVESLVLGKWKNLHIILAEDHSKDNSWNLCQELSHTYPQVQCIRNDKNHGVSYTRNRALDLALGEYVLFVDSDDWVSQNYVAHLLAAAQQTPHDSLVLCGYHYINHINGTNSTSYFAQDVQALCEIPMGDIFSLAEKVMLQQLWNKIFRRDIIESAHIRFDESQSMGEDFQFVLDYMEAMQCKKCVVLNEPLYYYIRWNNSSLMSNFGFTQNHLELDRMHQLYRISGESSTNRLDAMVAQCKQNYIYHIVRSPNHCKQEKLDTIERIMGDGLAKEHYSKQVKLHTKEKIVSILSNTKPLYSRIKGYFVGKILENRIARARNAVRSDGFTLISQNCIGGVIYHDLGMPFLTPTINAFIPEPDFVRFVLNLHYYMECELNMRWDETYPVGILGDVEIHFMHYHTCQEAAECWNRRKHRINWEKVMVLCTDRDGFDDSTFEQWKMIPYPKVLFTANQKYGAYEDSVYYHEYTASGAVQDLIPKRAFYKTGLVESKINTL